MSLSLDQALQQADIAFSAFRRIEGARDAPPPAAPGQTHFIAVLSGSGELSGSGGGPLPLAAGQLLLLPGGETLSPSPGLVLAHGYLCATLLDGRKLFDYIFLPHCLEAGETELFKSAIPELLRESACGGPGSAAIIACLARRLVTSLLRDAWPPSRSIDSAAAETRQQRLARIVELMRKDPGRDYTLEGLASAAAMSRTLFHREFVARHGSSPLAMLRSLRLNRARELLSQTDMPIKTIASRLGYRSRSHFCKLFKDACGTDPAEFRARAKAGQDCRQGLSG